MKKIIFLAILISFTVFISAQDDGFYGPTSADSKDVKKEKRRGKLENWSFGGNLWFRFGTYTYIDFSPVALYSVTPSFQLGGGITYIYERYKNIYYPNPSSNETVTQTINHNIYGPRFISQLTLLKDLDEKININLGNIFIYGEYAHLNTGKYYLKKNDEIIYDGSEWMGNLLVGGGIHYPLGNRAGFSLMVLYNFLQNEFSPYQNPIIRMGLFF